jgi:chromate transporter
MFAATLYLLKDISIMSFNTKSFLNIGVITGTVLLLNYTKIPAPFVVIFCLLIGLLV